MGRRVYLLSQLGSMLAAALGVQMYVDDLSAIASQLATLRGRFVEADGEVFLREEDQSRFSGLEAEARSLLQDALGPGNPYTMNIIFAVGGSSAGFLGGPSRSCVGKVEEQVRAAIREIKRKQHTAPIEAAKRAVKPAYVELQRLYELRTHKTKAWDFAKLIRLCDELNIAHEHECHHAVAMLVRAIMDHVPPVFGFKTFVEVSSNYGGGGSSFKKTMETLQRTTRNIADGHLHSPIRSREVLPNATQVEFSQALDLLLAEVIRIAPV